MHFLFTITDNYTLWFRNVARRKKRPGFMDSSLTFKSNYRILFFESNAMWYVLALVHMAIVHHVHGFSPFFPIFNLKNGFTDHLILVLIEMIFQYSRLYFGALERMLGILIFLRRTKNPGVGNTLGNWMHSMPCREKLLIGNATEDIQVHYSQCHWREKLRTAQIWKIPDFGRIRSMFSYKLLVKRAETSEIMHSKSYF